MDKLSDADEKRIVAAIKRAVHYANEGSTPSDAVIKAASEAELSKPMVQRMIEAFNTSSTLAYFKSASGPQRAASFPIAETDVILNAIWPEEPPTPAKEAAAAVDTSYFAFRETKDFMKVAEQRIDLPPMVEQPPEAYERDPGYFAKVAFDEYNALASLVKEAEAAYRDMWYRMMSAVEKAAAYWRGVTPAPGGKEDFALVEKRAHANFGKQAGPLMDWIYEAGKLGDARIGVKRASAEEFTDRQMSWGEGEPYQPIEDALFFAKQALRLAEEVAIAKEAADAYAVGAVDYLPPHAVERAIEAFLTKGAKKDMPSFTEQDRPAKVKDIYRALKREHPRMPAEMKARIASRRGSSNKAERKEGPPYKGPLARPKKSEKSSAAMDVVFG